jgi:uncharacterized membrane protein YphA (DoxX/SURF4 family)/thiol-disulfide isomerase/thioredoxin
VDSALFVARLALAAVFAVAGLAKLADRAGSIDAARSFGVPSRAAGPVAILLPVAELVVAALLLLPATARAGAAAALAMLSVFALAIVGNLSRGRRPDCHCFGQLHSAPVSWSTLSRDALLAVVAGLVVWLGPGSGAGLGNDRVLAVTAWLAVVALVLAGAWFAVNLLRQNGRILLRLDAIEEALSRAGLALTPVAGQAIPAPGLPVGSEAPDFVLSDLDGNSHTLRSLLSENRAVMLVFSAAECPPCADLMPEIRRWRRQHVQQLTIVVLETRETEDREPTGNRSDDVLVQQDHEVTMAYRIALTPSAVVVDSLGSIASPVAQGPDAVRELLSRAARGEFSVTTP